MKETGILKRVGVVDRERAEEMKDIKSGGIIGDMLREWSAGAVCGESLLERMGDRGLDGGVESEASEHGLKDGGGHAGLESGQVVGRLRTGGTKEGDMELGRRGGTQPPDGGVLGAGLAEQEEPKEVRGVDRERGVGHGGAWAE